MYDLYKDVPITPIIKRFSKKEDIYPVRDMEIGHSFHVPNKSVGTVRTACSPLAKELNYNLTIRRVPEVGKENGISKDFKANPWGDGGVGVWRLEGVYGDSKKNRKKKILPQVTPIEPKSLV